MSSRGVIASGSDAIQLVVGEGLLDWERRVWHQLDRFTFVRDDGVGVVIASGSDAIQLVVQEEAGLPRRFAPRDDGEETRSFAMRADRHCERERSNPVGGWRRVVGLGEKWLASAGSLRLRSR